MDAAPLTAAANRGRICLAETPLSWLDGGAITQWADVLRAPSMVVSWLLGGGQAWLLNGTARPFLEALQAADTVISEANAVAYLSDLVTHLITPLGTLGVLTDAESLKLVAATMPPEARRHVVRTLPKPAVQETAEGLLVTCGMWLYSAPHHVRMLVTPQGVPTLLTAERLHPDPRFEALESVYGLTFVQAAP